MPTLLKAHRVRIYPTSEQTSLLLRTFGCCRLVYNLALEQRGTFWRPGRRISFTSWSAELKGLKAEAEFLKEAPHHCLLQALKDLDAAYARFFAGDAAYPKPRRKFQNDSCRFPDPKQFEVGPGWIDLPKLGRVGAVLHRPIQGRLRSITVLREGGHWYASVLVKVRAPAPPTREVHEGGYDVNVAQPIVESDGTVHDLQRVSTRERERQRRLHKALNRREKGSKRRAKTRMALRRLEARLARRRRDAAHRVSHHLTRKYTHLAAEALALPNLTASARGTAAKPGRRVAQKAGLNRTILDLAPGQIRRLCAYKAAWRGGVFVCVDPAYTSQTCSECGRHPLDDPGTAHLPHGRINRDRFVCPLCGFAADADVNAARNVRARGRQHWAADLLNDDSPIETAAGPAVAARGAFCAEHGREAGTKILLPSGLPPAA